MKRFAQSQGKAAGSILLAALGYFVDIYDLILFSIVRVASLRDIGLAGDALLNDGVFLINMQMGGMLLGGLLWGILGDKKGRLSVLFGSIFMYSVANIANGFVQSVEAYAFWRFVAGIGLAGELGAGITLVCEIMPKETRGYGTMIVAGTGIFGGVAAGLVGDYFHWRTAYWVGGGMGLALLALRFGVFESGMFDAVLKRKDVARGDFAMLFKNGERAGRYLCSILTGVPIWFVIGILMTFSPELAPAIGLVEKPNPARVLMYFYLAGALGDFLSGAMSQRLESRRGIVGLFLAANAVFLAIYLWGLGGASLGTFYALCFALGLASGYWAVFVTMASEQFGTNIRATVTTTAPNFVRGSLVLLTSSFKALKPEWGLVGAAGVVGFASIAVALLALWRLEETYGKDLDFVER